MVPSASLTGGPEEAPVGGPAGGAGSTSVVRAYDELDRTQPPRLGATEELSPAFPLTLSIDAVCPTVQPPSFSLWFQLWIQHADGPAGWIARNGLCATGNP